MLSRNRLPHVLTGSRAANSDIRPFSVMSLVLFSTSQHLAHRQRSLPKTLLRLPLQLGWFIGMCFLLFAGTLGHAQAASIAFVQSNSADPQTPQTTVTVAYGLAQTAGNLNVVVVGWNDSTAKVSTVSDSRGNVYGLAAGPGVQTGIATQAIYYAKNIAAAGAGANTVTVTFTAAAIYPDIRIAEYSGIDTVNAVDVSAGAQGNSATSNSGLVTTTSANDLLVGANLVQTQTSGAGTGYTERVISSPDGDILEDRIVTATSVADNTKQGTAAITVTQASLNVAVSPKRSALTLSQTQQFTATVSNDPLNGGVTWAVDGNNGGNAITGTVSAAGLFTPGTQPGLHTVMATSNSNASV